jgi:molecular chaperone IbpA
MTVLAKYQSDNVEKFLRDVDRYSIGMDEWFHRMGTLHQTESNYPPYNLVKEDSITFRLEVALAGFKKEEIIVTTESGKLFVEGQTEKEDVEYVHQGLAKRAFTRSWTLSDDVEVRNVVFEDGLLTIELKRIIPEHQQRKVWF